MLKAGFIGFGRMGITHFSILNTHPLVKTVSICEQSNTMLKMLQNYLDIKIYKDLSKMMEENELDFVIISTPTDSHIKIVKEAIDNGLHIFAEKPFALTPIEGKEALNHLMGKNLINQVGYVNRFNEVFMKIKKLLDTGVIGEIRNFCAEMYGASVLKDSKSSWRGKKKTGGGCMYEFASHCIDLVVYFFGVPDNVVGSIMQSIYSSDVEDLISSTFIYNAGYSGTVLVNWSDEAYRKPTFRFTIFGKEGKIIADQHTYKIYLKQAVEEYQFIKGWNTRYITDIAKSVRFYVRGNEFTNQLDYFIDCIKKRDLNNISSFEEAHKTDIIMDNIRKDSARSINIDDVKVLNSAIYKNTKQKNLFEKITKFINR
jgi:predicted dehydrogenase